MAFWNFVISIILPLIICLFIDIKLRNKFKGTSLNFLALGLLLYLSTLFDWLYSCIRHGFSFDWVVEYLIFRLLFIALAVVSVFYLNKICQCQSKISQVIVSLIVFGIILATCYGIYDLIKGYQYSLFESFPILDTIIDFGYVNGIGEIVENLIILVGEILIIYPYPLMGIGDENEYATPKKEKVRKTYSKPNNKYDDQIEAIKKYKKLLDDGLISEEDYKAKKKEILG